MKNIIKCWKDFFGYFNALETHSNQIYLATLTQASFLQKNQTLQNVFFYISNAGIAQCRQEFRKIQTFFDI